MAAATLSLQLDLVRAAIAVLRELPQEPVEVWPEGAGRPVLLDAIAAEAVWLDLLARAEEALSAPALAAA